MGKGSGRRPAAVSDSQIEKAWNSIFDGHPNESQHKVDKNRTIQLNREKALDAALADWGGREHDKFVKEFAAEDDYGNELPKGMTDKEKQPKPHNPKDPDRFVDETGDA